MEATDKIKQACDAIARYYKTLEADYDALFSTYCDDNEFDEDAVTEELNVAADECQLLDFDDDFPFATPPKNEQEKQAQILEVINRCWQNPKGSYLYNVQMPPVDKNLYQITEKEIEDVKKIYAKQCPILWNSGMDGDQTFLRILAIGRKYKFDYLQHLVDDYFCARIDKIDISFQEDEWSSNHPHFRRLKKIKANVFGNKPAENEKQIPQLPHEIAVGAVKSFGARCCPKLLLSPIVSIDDSLEITVKYIHAIVNFIRGLVDDRFKNRAICPFQLDFCIASGKPKDKDNKVTLNADDDDDDNDDDNKTKEVGFVDCVQDIAEKLEKNKLTYGKGTFDADADLEIKSRTFAEIFDAFVKKLGASEKKEDYPHNRRFITFVDRRKTADEKSDGDPTYIYEPPVNCRNIPHDVVPEWYINASRTCLLPDMDYGDGKKAEAPENSNKNSGTGPQATREQLLKSNIGSSFHCKGALLTLSFIVKEIDAMKMYMYWNGQIIRLRPKDIKPVLMNVFNMKWKGGDAKSANDVFAESEEIDQLIQQIEQKVTDKYYESFKNKYAK